MISSDVPKTWDVEADIIVVGGGNTGIPAAITAHVGGAKVIVVEASGGMASNLAMIAWYALYRNRPAESRGY